MKIIKVVCGIIWKEDKVFIARRKPEKSMGGFWEFPGGKIEEGEEPETALKRELKEELGMDVLVKEYFGTNVHQYDTFIIELIAYTCEFVSASFQLTDHDEWKFVPVNEFSEYNFADADVKLLKIIK